MKTERVHFLRNEDITICGRKAPTVKSSPFLIDVNCRMCLGSFPVEITSDNIINILQNSGYELDGTNPVFIKLIDGRLYIKKSRWMRWDKIDINYNYQK